MAKIGLKYPVYALATETTNAISYASGAVLAKAIAANIKIDVNNVNLYADDGIAEIDRSFKGGTITLNADDLSDAVKVALLGYTEGAAADAGIGSKEMSAGGSTTPASVGFGFYGKRIKSGVASWRAIWLKKVQFAEPAEDAKTKGESVEFQTPTLEGTILLAADGLWKEEGTFSSETNAKNWLDAKAGLPVSASAGISGLAMTGAGGTLAPAFGASIRYYSYAGVSATEVKIKITAASHTIKLYVDGVYLEDLTSGSDSSAIAMASGTKKLTVIAQEAGKTAQTTEVVVQKT